MFRRAIIGISAMFSLGIATQAWALGPIIVFFERGSVRLTPQAEAVLDGAALRRNTVSEYIAIGHSDREGSAASNLILSRRRALVVRDALVARGVPAERIRTEAYGESRPLIDTEDGVAEAQNRRVEVIAAPSCGYRGGPPC